MKTHGADILRLWVVSGDYTEDLRIGEEILDGIADTYRRLRNTLRYLLGNLAGFTEAERLPPDEMPELERWVLHRLAELDEQVRELQPRVRLSAALRRAAQFLRGRPVGLLLRRPQGRALLRPARQRPPPRRAHRARRAVPLPDRLAGAGAGVHHRGGLAHRASRRRRQRAPASCSRRCPPAGAMPALGERWERIREIRRVVTGALELERREKRIGASLQAAPDRLSRRSDDRASACRASTWPSWRSPAASCSRTGPAPADALHARRRRRRGRGARPGRRARNARAAGRCCPRSTDSPRASVPALHGRRGGAACGLSGLARPLTGLVLALAVLVADQVTKCGGAAGARRLPVAGGDAVLQSGAGLEPRRQLRHVRRRRRSRPVAADRRWPRRSRAFLLSGCTARPGR